MRGAGLGRKTDRLTMADVPTPRAHFQRMPKMKRKLLTATVFMFGLALGGTSAIASSPSPEATVPGITQEMARCVYECQSNGGTHAVCWNCCVRNICELL
ncbi:hypothetical protein COSO111634_24610 [Corallococcus soli]